MIKFKFFNYLIDLVVSYKKISSIKYEKKEIEGKNIVFNTVRMLSLPLHQELFLAYQLAEMGAKITVLLDDGLLKHWDTYQEHDNFKFLNPYNSGVYIKSFLIIKTFIIKRIYNHPNITFVYFSQILNNSNIDVELNNFEKSHAVSSVRRYFENGKYDEADKKQNSYYQESLFNCKLTKIISRNLVLKQKIDLVITSHGIYSTWGVFYINIKKKNIPILVYGAHAYRSNEIIISDVLAQILSQDSDWIEFSKNTKLTSQKKEEVVAYFNSRINHTAFDTTIYYSHIKKFEDVLIDKKNAVTYGMFPNIIWDGDVKERDTLFDGIIDWMKVTVNFFKNSNNNLVIRFHPAEATLWKDSKSLELIIKKEIPDILNYKNITLISAVEKINTYSFIKKNIDVGLIYDGVLAMELVYLGKPVISCANSRYTGAGFVIEPRSLEHYFLLLKNGFDIIEKFKTNYSVLYEKLLQYSYWYFFMSGYSLPIFDRKIPLKINYRHHSSASLSKNENPLLNRTMEKIKTHFK